MTLIGALIEGVRFATDSPLEGEGFEPSVPREGNYATRLPPDRENQVRSGLAAGGGSHERTRLWTPGFPASWENTGNFLRRASILHHIAIKRRVVSSTCWPIP